MSEGKQMIYLLTFVACERLIQAQDEGITIVTLIEDVAMSFPEGYEVTSKAASDRPFVMFASYRFDEEAKRITYNESIQLFLPNGELAGEATSEFTPNATIVRSSTRADSFPVGIKGVCTLKLTLTRSSDEQLMVEAHYPIEVFHEFFKPDETENISA